MGTVYDTWGIRPGDFVECVAGQRGTVLSVCTGPPCGQVFAVEVGFEWIHINDVISWIPKG